MKMKSLSICVVIILILSAVALFAYEEAESSGAAGSPDASGAGVASLESATSYEASPVMETRPGMDMVLGIVRGGKLYPVSESEDIFADVPVRLTAIAMQESISPDAREIFLHEYEGLAVMVEGLDSGGWIYDAFVVDIAGPILTAVVKQAFRENDD